MPCRTGAPQLPLLARTDARAWRAEARTLCATGHLVHLVPMPGDEMELTDWQPGMLVRRRTAPPTTRHDSGRQTTAPDPHPTCPTNGGEVRWNPADGGHERLPADGQMRARWRT